MTPHRIYFDKKALRFTSASFLPESKSMVLVSTKTAVRIAKKLDVMRIVDHFINTGIIDCIHATGGEYPRHPDLSSTCGVKKDGVWYDFLTDNESFIPLATDFPEVLQYGGYNRISKLTFKTIMASKIFKDRLIVPLNDMEKEDYAEFDFYQDAYAYDGTGIRYQGQLWYDKKVHLVPYIYYENWTSINESYNKDCYVCRANSDAEALDVERFIAQAIDIPGIEEHLRQLELQRWKRLNNEYGLDRKFMKEDGSIDIYGEPDGWQFNNEDWC